MRLALTVALVLSTACAVSAQAPNPTPAPTPAEGTKLEKFQARTGAVIIKGYSEIGKLTGTSGGMVEVTSMEFTDAQSGVKLQGVVIGVRGPERYDRETRSYIDYDEIDSLLKGIDYIAKVEPGVTKLSNFEASYRTRGDFTVTIFNSPREGSTSVAISAGRLSDHVFLRQGDLATFRELILLAKGKLDSAR